MSRRRQSSENRVVIADIPLAQGLLGGRYGVDNRPGPCSESTVRDREPAAGRASARACTPAPTGGVLTDLAKENFGRGGI